MLTRAQLLGQIMENYKYSIAVSGTHGKTTTTSMLSYILIDADTDPTISVGGILDSIGDKSGSGNDQKQNQQTFFHSGKLRRKINKDKTAFILYIGESFFSTGPGNFFGTNLPRIPGACPPGRKSPRLRRFYGCRSCFVRTAEP